MTPLNDTQLKQALAKMLPDSVEVSRSVKSLVWLRQEPSWRDGEIIHDTELLHLCYLAECQILRTDEIGLYMEAIDEDGDWNLCHATWQQRVIALAKVKGIEI